MAEQRALEAEQVIQVLDGMLYDFSPNAFEGTVLDTSLVVPILNSLHTRIRDNLAGQPHLQAPLLHDVGSILHSHDLYAPALHLFREVDSVAAHLTPSEIERWSALAGFGIGRALIEMGAFDAAETELQHVLSTQLQFNRIDPHVMARTYRRLGHAVFGAGRYDDALMYYEAGRDVLAQAGMEHPPLYSMLLNNIGVVTRLKGDADSALALHLQAQQHFQTYYSPGHPNLGSVQKLLGYAYADLGQHAEAEAAFREALTILSAHFPSTHTRVVQQYESLGGYLLAQLRFEDVEALYREALSYAGDGHLHWSRTLFQHRLAQALYGQNRHDEALTYHKAAWTFERDHPSPWHDERIRDYAHAYAQTALAAQNYTAAATLLKEGQLFLEGDPEWEDRYATLSAAIDKQAH